MSVETLAPTTNAAWRVDVNTGTEAVPVWTQVRASSSVVPAVNPTTQDATDYDSEGWGSDAVTLRKWQLQLVLMRKVDATAAYDPGQEKLRAAADAVELVHVRWYDRTAVTAEAYEGEAIVQWQPTGGPADGLQTVNATCLGQGARREIAHPGV
ncbi:MAG TPA: hypothetical protein VIQ30_22670 [Pseudonocardia sp.]